MDWPKDYTRTLDPAPTNVKRGTIRLTYRMMFNLACNREGLHANHPDKVTFLAGARLGAELWSAGQAVVTGVFHEHEFRFDPDQYEVVRGS
jgi:hypothetical protein